ncbi:hypothetical protein SAMN05660284_02248 [Formivibrio citricus]|uniref:Nitroimidazol reductase NimA, pyridoxamine 5'-phosphate oxidase superfamily n=1 Tax=Formivibrio citricus TaxID=83765 RepID=A0A1I5BUM9_9NEIS|nr:pyridoxamine 5'-phosphate oxidase family protein [Formivibrio citricus]SFN78322.1 hypothetical protein SAMN05660284_02248 [Formivibrio citricus]
MHKPVRRQDRETGAEEAESLLAGCLYGVLATTSADGQPYAVPLSYVFHAGNIYFHCAPEGQKLDNIQANPAVSFCVVGHVKTLPGKFSTEYESAVVFGAAEEIHGDEKQEALLKILEKYSPDHIPQGQKYIAGMFERTAVVRIAIRHLTGKARR